MSVRSNYFWLFDECEDFLHSQIYHMIKINFSRWVSYESHVIFSCQRDEDEAHKFPPSPIPIESAIYMCFIEINFQNIWRNCLSLNRDYRDLKFNDLCDSRSAITKRQRRIYEFFSLLVRFKFFKTFSS